MHCPKCVSSDLKRTGGRQTRVVVDLCTNCKGLWLDEGELNQVMEVASKDLKPPRDAKPTRMTCPRCCVPLLAFHYPQTYVEINMCGQCHGLWLEPGELREIKVVRNHLKNKGQLQTHAPVVGFKGDLLRWIDSAIDSLLRYDEV